MGLVKSRKRIPNVVRGGKAVPISNDLFLMQGRKHEQGGIDIGESAKNGLEVEGGEVMQIGKNNVRVFSAVPFLNGQSPSQLVQSGANPNSVFNAQEQYKDRNHINDDGTKARAGLSRKTDYGSSKKPYPSVSSGDFAGGGRSYPIPTKADAVDALRLAGLHGRSDVKAKVYARYPELRKKAPLGTEEYNDGISNLLFWKNKDKQETSQIQQSLAPLMSQENQNQISLPIENDENNESYENTVQQRNDDRQEKLARYINYYQQLAESIPRINTGQTISQPQAEFAKVNGSDSQLVQWNTNVDNALKTRGNIAQEMYDTCISMGYSPEVACGILANSMHESAGFQNIWERDPNAKNRAFGYFQMGASERAEYAKWKQKNADRIKGKPEHITQTMYVCEQVGKYNYSGNVKGYNTTTNDQAKAMMKSNNPAEAAIGFMLLYEKPGITADNARKAYANRLYQYFNSNNKQIMRMGGFYNRINNSAIFRLGGRVKAQGGVKFGYLLEKANRRNREIKQGLEEGKKRKAQEKVQQENSNKNNDKRTNNQTTHTILNDYKSTGYTINKGYSTPTIISNKSNVNVQNSKKTQKQNIQNVQNEQKKSNKSTSKQKVTSANPDWDDRWLGLTSNSSTGLITSQNTNTASSESSNGTRSNTSSNRSTTSVSAEPPFYSSMELPSDAVQTSINKGLSRLTGFTNVPEGRLAISNMLVDPNNPESNYNIPLLDINTNSSKKKEKSSSGNNFNLSNSAGDLISLGSNVGGSLAGFFLNRKAIRNRKRPARAALMPKSSLNTDYNINPQLEALQNAQANYERDIDANTASSKTALARKQAGRRKVTESSNQLYALKNNTENQMINENRKFQSEIDKENTARVNTNNKEQYEFDLKKNQDLADNKVALANNLNSAVQGLISTSRQRTKDNNTIAAILAGSPDVSKELLESIGLRLWGRFGIRKNNRKTIRK